MNSIEYRTLAIKIKDLASLIGNLKVVENLRKADESISKVKDIINEFNNSPEIGAVLSSGIKVLVHDIHGQGIKNTIMVADGALRVHTLLRFVDWAKDLDKVGEQHIGVSLVSGINNISDFIKKSNDHRKITTLQLQGLSANLNELTNLMKAEGRFIPIEASEARDYLRARNSYLLVALYSFFSTHEFSYKANARQAATADWTKLLQGVTANEFSEVLNFILLCQERLISLPRDRRRLQVGFNTGNKERILTLNGGILSCIMHTAGRIRTDLATDYSAIVLATNKEVTGTVKWLEKMLQSNRNDVNASCNAYSNIRAKEIRK